MSRTIATIEARMTSSRLPGKVLMEAAGRPFLVHLLDRLRKVPSLDGIVVATTTNASDDPIEALCATQGVACFRGSEQDVLARVIGAAEHLRAEVVVEITADCPLIDPKIIEEVVQLFRTNACDYASNVQVRSYPDGMDVQVFPLAILKRSAELVETKAEREHVTMHIRNNPHLFRQVTLIAKPPEYWPDLGLTLDEEADFQLLKKIAEHFEGRDFSCGEIIALLRSHPDWVSLNSHVARKGFGV